MAETLTIVGASARAAAASARRAGLEPLAGDMFADLDLQALTAATRVIDYPRGLARVIAAPQPGGWIYTGGLENQPALVGRLANLRPLWGNHAAVLRRVRAPWLVAETLRGAGIACPELHRPADGSPPPGDWLHKPRRSSGGLRIRHWAPGNAATHRGSDAYFQQFVAGTPCAAAYLAAGGQALLLGITEQLIGAAWLHCSGFRYAGSLGPLSPSPTVQEQFVTIGNALAAGFGLAGLFGVDAVLSADGVVWPVEVNPRYTASLEILERGYGWAALAAHVETCRSGSLSPAPGMTDGAAPRLVCGKAVLFARRNVRVSEDLARRWLSASSVAASPPDDPDWPLYADVPPPGTFVPRSGPILTLLASGSDTQDVCRRLQVLAAATQGEIETADAS